MRVRKAVVPAAGLGTRFLPVTKTVPKEMLPIVDRPLISFVIEEAAAAGIEHVILIAGRGKSAIEDFFDRAYELELRLEQDGKSKVLQDLRHWQNQVQLSSVRQQQALGLGHAILCAEQLIADEPFAVLLGDEIMRPKNQNPLPIEQLVKHFECTQISCVSIMNVALSEVRKYGIVRPKSQSAQDVIDVLEAVEKPEPSNAPSNWALPGRYVFSSEIFTHLHQTPASLNGEIQLTDAINRLAKSSGVQGLPISCRRFDAGDKFGFLQANIELGLEHPEVREPLRAYLRQIAGDL